MTRKPSVVKDLLGQLATKDFWRDMAKQAIKELFVGFITTLCGSILWYVKNKVKSNTGANDYSSSASSPSNVFSRPERQISSNYADSFSYGRDYPPVGQSSYSNGPSFPGF